MLATNWDTKSYKVKIFNIVLGASKEKTVSCHNTFLNNDSKIVVIQNFTFFYRRHSPKVVNFILYNGTVIPISYDVFW